MLKYSGASFIWWRYFFILFLILLAVTGIIGRVFYLAVDERQFLLNQGDARTVRIIPIPAYRGMITDRNGNPLAISTPVVSIWVDPKHFVIDKEQLLKLCHLLDLNFSEVIGEIHKNSKREFLYLKRRIDPFLAKQVKALNIPGVYERREFKRFYPDGAATAHLIGFTNVDDHGQEGLELTYDQWLAGIPGKKRVLKDRLGAIVDDLATLQEPHSGNTLVLSIDRRIQFLAYKSLQQAVKEYQAASGSVVVLDVKTGEVLAMVNLPSFNPNLDINHVGANFRNRAVTDVFEPGSTMKVFSIASALDSNKYTPNSVIDIGKGYFVVDKSGHVVRDEHATGLINVRTILQKSSNVGVAKMTLSLPPEQLWSLLHRVGFGEKTQSHFPGERDGSLVNHRIWRPITLATLAFGYGISVTTLQLAHAYAVIADDGKKIPITLLRREEMPAGVQAIDSKVANQMLQMLQYVVETGGTGTKAQVPGYHVAGKTGTARIAGNHGYNAHHHVGSFVGIAPIANPRLVVAVVINEPHKVSYYGGIIAAPVFSQVMGGALRILGVPPDNIATLTSTQKGSQ